MAFNVTDILWDTADYLKWFWSDVYQATHNDEWENKIINTAKRVQRNLKPTEVLKTWMDYWRALSWKNKPWTDYFDDRSWWASLDETIDIVLDKGSKEFPFWHMWIRVWNSIYDLLALKS